MVPLLLPLAMLAAWYLSYADAMVWGPGALALLAVVAAASWWQDKHDKGRSGSSIQAIDPGQTLQLIQSRRSIYPKDFSGAFCLNDQCCGLFLSRALLNTIAKQQAVSSSAEFSKCRLALHPSYC